MRQLQTYLVHSLGSLLLNCKVVWHTQRCKYVHRTVAGVEMIWFDTFEITGGIHQAIGRVCGDGHSTAEVVHKKAIGAPLAGVVPGLESVTHHLEVTLYVLDKTEDLGGVT